MAAKIVSKFRLHRIVFVTKYRGRIMTGDVAKETEQCISHTTFGIDVEMVRN